MEKLIIDSDVLINWLAQEEESSSNRKLWIAPSIILELGEKGQLQNYISMLSILEIRFVLRRKKDVKDKVIERDIQLMNQILAFLTPSQEELEEANQLQSEQYLDPFDSIILAQAITRKGKLITRDSSFLKTAKNYVDAFTPEEYIEYCLKI